MAKPMVETRALMRPIRSKDSSVTDAIMTPQTMGINDR